MRILILILFALPAMAQTVIQDSFTVQSGAATPIIAWTQANFLSEADTDENGTVSTAEAIAWHSARRQQTFNAFVAKAILDAEQRDPTLLPQAYRNALTALAQAQAALQAQRELLCPDCW